MVKGIRFEELRDVGDPVELARRYESEGADEIVFLDISASIEERATLLETYGVRRSSCSFRSRSVVACARRTTSGTCCAPAPTR